MNIKLYQTLRFITVITCIFVFFEHIGINMCRNAVITFCDYELRYVLFSHYAVTFCHCVATVCHCVVTSCHYVVTCCDYVV